MPTITESAEALHQRIKQEKDSKKRQRLPALYLVASGHVRHRTELAVLLGVHRHSVAAWLAAYAAGGLDQALHSRVPRPPIRQRITTTAWAALQDQRQDRPALRAMRSCARGEPSRIRDTSPIRGALPWCGGNSVPGSSTAKGAFGDSDVPQVTLL
jgi:Homeodomain-like domain